MIWLFTISNRLIWKGKWYKNNDMIKNDKGDDNDNDDDNNNNNNDSNEARKDINNDSDRDNNDNIEGSNNSNFFFAPIFRW